MNNSENMNIAHCLDQIHKGQDVRKNLIELKKKLKENGGLSDRLSQENLTVLTDCLSHEDAKVRKNAAQIIGELGDDRAGVSLYTAYEKECTLFVRPAMVHALGMLDYRDFSRGMKQRLQVLLKAPVTDENRKHIDQERHELAELLRLIEKDSVHEFCGWGLKERILLLTGPGFEKTVAAGLRAEHAVPVAGGVLVTASPGRLMENRLWKNMLFLFARHNGFEPEPEKIAAGLMDHQLLSWLDLRHRGSGPYTFRLDLRTRKNDADKNRLLKGTALALEGASHGRLINSASDYEIELRLIEGKDGRFLACVRLCTFEDPRFKYRKNFLPVSENPVTSAQMLAFAAKWLRDGANVLDPFCGVGTLLAERRYFGSVRGLYGVDISAQAIDGGRKNLAAAKMAANFIRRDFFDFRHDYLFDEIISNLPDHGFDEADAKAFYGRFLGKANTLMASNAVLVLYVRHPQAFREAAGQKFEIAGQCEISRKTQDCILVVRKTVEKR
ncbi:MAG: methyltransferase domain-containing protein [Catenibacillus sp.]